MTIGKCIDTVDEIYPNEFDYNHKITWLNQLENELFQTLFSKYDCPFVPPSLPLHYDGSTPETTEMLAPAMFEEIYVQWILANIYKAREETIKYNNIIEIYNQVMYELRAYVAREYTHKKQSNFKNYKG